MSKARHRIADPIAVWGRSDDRDVSVIRRKAYGPKGGAIEGKPSIRGTNDALIGVFRPLWVGLTRIVSYASNFDSNSFVLTAFMFNPNTFLSYPKARPKSCVK